MKAVFQIRIQIRINFASWICSKSNTGGKEHGSKSNTGAKVTRGQKYHGNQSNTGAKVGNGVKCSATE